MRWPVSEPSSTNNVLARHCPAPMGVGAVVAIVAENKIIVGGDLLAGVSIFGWFHGVRLNQRGVIDEHRAVLDFYGVSWHRDNSFDKVGVGIAWGMKNDYLSALRGMEKISGFADHNVLAGSDTGQHG